MDDLIKLIRRLRDAADSDDAAAEELDPMHYTPDDPEGIIAGLEFHARERRECADALEAANARIAELEAQIAAAGKQEPIHQAMATDDDLNNGDLWMDVDARAFELMKKRSDVRTRIVYPRPCPSDAEGWRKDAEVWRNLLTMLIREIPQRHWRPDDPNAPGHAHSRPGIWDSDNGPLSGTQCAWCATWNEARAALAKQPEGQ